MTKATLKSEVLKYMEFFLRKNSGGVRAKELGDMVKEKIDESQMFSRPQLHHSIVAQFSILTREHHGKYASSREKGRGVIYSLSENYFPLQTTDDVQSVHNSPEKKEEDFYPSFARYLEYGDGEGDENRLDECTKAVAWGGNKSGEKWGTPDVVGVFKPMRNANVQFPHEIITAEVKTNAETSALITAFGQACAYRLFSHKTYLAVPKQGKSDRLEALCHVFGIGLIYFDKDAEEITPNIYQMELRAQKHSPDMFYVNKFVEGELADKLYGK